jgi:hypothetical protein
MEEHLNIKKVDLLIALQKAFDEGWNGYKDLKESVVEKLFNELYESRLKEEASQVITTDFWGGFRGVQGTQGMTTVFTTT